jgi:hypothetical protein
VGLANGEATISSEGDYFVNVGFKYNLGSKVYDANGLAWIVVELLLERNKKKYWLSNNNGTVELFDENLLFSNNHLRFVIEQNKTADDLNFINNVPATPTPNAGSEVLPQNNTTNDLAARLDEVNTRLQKMRELATVDNISEGSVVIAENLPANVVKKNILTARLNKISKRIEELTHE